MNSLIRTTAVVLTSLTLTGCISLLTNSATIQSNHNAKAEHHYTFYVKQAQRIADKGQCVMAANHFQTTVERRMDYHVRKTDQADAYKERYQKDSQSLAKNCTTKTIPTLTTKRDYRRISKIYVALSKLPVPKKDQEQYLYQSKTTNLLEAKHLQNVAEEAWQQRDYPRAISLYASSVSTAKRVAKIAKPGVIAQYQKQYLTRKQARAQQLIQAAQNHERSSRTNHLALLEYARANKLAPSNQLKRKIAALKKIIRNETFFDYTFNIEGNPTLAQKATAGAKKQIKSGNLRMASGQTLSIKVSLSAPKFSLKKNNVQLSGRYANGTKLVMNPKYQQAVKYRNRMQNCVSNWYGKGTGQWTGSRWQDIGCHSSNLDTNKSEIRRMQRLLAKTPQQIQETTYATQRYPAVRHDWTVEVTMAQTITQRGKTKTYQQPLRFTHTDHTHGAVPRLKLSAKTARAPGEPKLLRGAGDNLAKMISQFINKDYGQWLGTLAKSGTKGQVQYLLMNSSNARQLDKQIEQATKIPDASLLLR